MVNKTKLLMIGVFSIAVLLVTSSCKTNEQKAKKPNILFAIADDQSFPYASVYGTPGIHTPAFDEVAQNGILFTNAFVAAPQCSPSRAAILTGKNIWQLEEAGTHSSYFPRKFTVFTDLLEKAGYKIGFTGKPWSPGNWKEAGWSRNPVGPEYNNKTFDSVPAKGISKTDYFENFKEFYSEKNSETPFFFWYGGHEPHRVYEDGSALKSGKNLSDAVVPSFLPDVDLVKSDVLDYFLEIEWFDEQLEKMLGFLDEKGELENTLIVVTADNGMPFPYAKANVQEYGTHVPLAICWPKKIEGNRIITDLVGMIDLAPTFLEIADVKEKPEMTGQSLVDLLLSGNTSSAIQKYVLTGRERHTHARPDNLGYPARAIRTEEYLFILNMKPDRWPAGDPAPDSLAGNISEDEEKTLWPGYNDIDNGPTKIMLIENREKYPEYFKLGYDKRPEEELFDIKNDPACIHNLAGDPNFQAVKNELRKTLENDLKAQGDPRMNGTGDVFESYPRFGGMRDLPGFKERGKYNPIFLNGHEMINTN